MTTSDIYRRMVQQQLGPFGDTAPFKSTVLDKEGKLKEEIQKRIAEEEGLRKGERIAPSPFKGTTASFTPTGVSGPDLGMSGMTGQGPKGTESILREGESAFVKGTEVSSDYIVRELSNIQRDPMQPDSNIYRRLISERVASDGTHYRVYQYAKMSDKDVNKLGFVEAFSENAEYDFGGTGKADRYKIPVYRHFLVKSDSKEGFSPDFEIAVKPEAEGKNITDLEVKDFWFSDPTLVDVGPGRFMGKTLSKDAPIREKKWLVDSFRNIGKSIEEVQTKTRQGKSVFEWKIGELDPATVSIPGGEITGKEMMGGGEDEIERGMGKLEEDRITEDLDQVTTDLDQVTDDTGISDRERQLQEDRDRKKREGMGFLPEKEVTNVQSAGGTFESVLKSIGIDTGPLGISQFDLPGFPEDLFNRDDYLIDVTTREKFQNNSFDREQEAPYTQDQTGMRIDQNGVPEFFVIETTTQEPNPEIEAALEAYALALRANTDLSGSVAQVISAQINATEGMGIGADRLNPQELANLKRNISLISASEGILTAPGQFEEELAQQRLREISTGQRGGAAEQLANIYSSPIAYGMVTSTEEGKEFLKNLQAQATYDPFAQMELGRTPRGYNPADLQQIPDVAPTGAPTIMQTAGGFGIGQNVDMVEGDPNMLLASGNNIPLYDPLPSARRYEQEMSLVEKGRAQAEAAKRGIYGEQELRKAIQTLTPLGYDFGGSAKGTLAPKTRKKSTVADPWAGSVQMAGW